MVHLLKPVICLALVLLAPGLQAGVYKWVDDQGRVHYGDKPTSTNADEVDIKDQYGSGQADQPASRRELQQRFLRAREAERNEKKKARAEQKQKRAEAKRNCARAKKEYDKYRYAGSIYVKGKDGEREYLSLKDRASYEKSLAAKITKWCKR
ncbi:DUF4124 domain-containing protein [Sulfuriflexus sp.]|uniref:DUF4124 domain-containing protein n=1 Tax=Sulfuriflexus sp. TaxID=2015443 RepID=UPI0028CC05BF|nr:DUF4124 domain-containing protein [Sulfuriflexus sp.]MDT8403171.1 DUF4124 domain-containing protein [Sulfuriflexus sp.]